MGVGERGGVCVCGSEGETVCVCVCVCVLGRKGCVCERECVGVSMYGVCVRAFARGLVWVG